MSDDLIELAEKFWPKVDRRGPNDCWPWLGSKLKKDGRGVLTVNRKNIVAPRVALALDGRPVPAGLFACHSCDNPNCVNPAHLWIGSNKDNIADASKKRRLAAQKGLVARGEKHWRSKLTDDAVRAIRAELSQGASQRALARKYGVAFCSVNNIANNTAWRHVK